MIWHSNSNNRGILLEELANGVANLPWWGILRGPLVGATLSKIGKICRSETLLGAVNLYLTELYVTGQLTGTQTA